MSNLYGDGASGRRPRSISLRRRHLVAVVVLAVGLGATACGGGGETSTSDSTTTTASSTPSSPGTAKSAVSRVGCTKELLTAAVAKKHADGAVADESCDSAFAIATVRSADLGGEGIGFFAAADGAWQLTSSVPMTADPASVAPKDFPASLIRTWQFRFESARKPTTTRAPVVTRPGSDPDDPRFAPTTMFPLIPTTTVPPTTRPTTTEPPVETVPTAPPPTPPTTKPGCDLNRPFTCI